MSDIELPLPPCPTCGSTAGVVFETGQLMRLHNLACDELPPDTWVFDWNREGEFNIGFDL